MGGQRNAEQKKKKEYSNSLIFASSSFANPGAYNGIKLRLHNLANNSVQTLVWYPVVSEKIEVIKLGNQRSKWIEFECPFK